MSLVRNVSFRRTMFLVAATLLRNSAAWQVTAHQRPLALCTSRTGVRRSFLTPSSSRSTLPQFLTLLYSASTKKSSESVSVPSPADKKVTKQPVPITLLSGFLGTGKTTALKHLLENAENVKIGVIVNDVASVNIDAKLINANAANANSQSAMNGMVELQNGCACCSLADELFFSVEKILQGRNLDAIVVELSGVADPAAIQTNWRMAPLHIRQQAVVARVVTVVDAASFGTDFLTWDQARERQGWVTETEQFMAAGQRKVSELLAEQVEAADLILLNKIDMAENEEQIQVAAAVARALNPKAELVRVQYGKISPHVVLGKQQEEQAKEVCHEPACTDTSHSHSHDHHHAAAAATVQADAVSCNDPACEDSSHSHSHSHDHHDDASAACQDPDCSDPSHSHSHDHAATSIENLGIVNFCYKASRPFDPVRLMYYLDRWPVPVKEELDLGILKHAKQEGYEVNGQAEQPGEAIMDQSPFLGVLRSKGYCWFAPNKWSGANEDAWRHDTAMFWSHAGKSFSIYSVGKWWGTLTRDQMKKYFADNNLGEYERILQQDFVTEEFGDRRNEIVFIGTDLDEKRITEVLDSCLYTEEEMEGYRQKLQNYQNTIISTSKKSGLFNVRSVEHTDAL